MILVTGATGHVGRSLVTVLVEKGETVRVLVRDKNVELEGVEMVQGDLLDINTIKTATAGAETIYHLAASVDYKPVPKKLMYDVNVIGTKNLLDKSEAKTFIYLSSTSVYGRRPRENPVRETTAYNPSSYYGETKAIAEKMVLEKGGIVLRAPVIYGPGFNEGFDFVLSQIKKGKMRIIGDGKNAIQWIHIRDLVQALLLAKDNGVNGEVYLVAGDEIRTQEGLFSLLAKYLNVPAPSKRVSTLLINAMAYYKLMESKLNGKVPKVTPDQISRIVSDRTFDISKAKTKLGFQPEVNYETGAREIVGEYELKTRAPEA